ncbi:hypothetical protein [Pseudomonas sp. 25 E 4]|nr:hypothetical protein [Pseudomonas sp. 25 E 4]CRM32715.1 hypothetical protein [Pseudomonas sp. 25 E 4]
MFAFARIENAGEVAGFVVVVLAAVVAVFLLRDGVGVEAVLVVVVVMAEQLALLSLLLLARFE